jgi:hypothetical protein
MSDAPEDKPQFQLTRPSASADASRAAEKARLWAMSPLERALRALELGLMCQRLLPVAEDSPARAK